MSLAEFNDQALATMEEYRPEMVDAIHSGSPTYQFMKEAGIVEVKPCTGPSYVRPILARDVQEPLWFRGADEHTFSPQDTGEGARFRWYNVRMPIQITEEELKENAGDAQRMEILGMKVRAAELTLRDRYNKAFIWTRSCYSYVYGATSTNLPDGIPAIMGLSTNGTVTRTYGELARSSSTWFRSQLFSANGAAVASAGFRRLWLDCTRDGFSPGLVLCNQPAYTQLGRLLEAKVTLNIDVSGGKRPSYAGGWEGLTYMGAQVRWDPDIKGLHGTGASADGIVWLMNKDFWGLREDTDWNWYLLPFEGPKGNATQLVRQSFILHRCGMHHDNPRFCGTYMNASAQFA